MLQLTQCKLPYREATRENLIRKTAHTLHLEEEEITGFEIVKKSIDARRKPDIFATYTVRFSAAGEERIWKRNRKNTRLSRVEKEPSLWGKSSYCRSRSGRFFLCLLFEFMRFATASD